MSSTQSFLRQIPTGLSFYSLPSNTASIFEFVPTTANSIPGNYPPGFVVAAASLTTSLQPYLVRTGGPYTNSTTPAAGYVMRDMGKTIKARIADSEGAAQNGTPSSTVVPNPELFYRQFQILKPADTAAFGVQGEASVPTSYADWVTIYVPVTVLGTGVSAAGVLPIAGGQM
jgi:hypothetical protein